MKRYTIKLAFLMILLNLVSLKILSQDTNRLNYKEINKYLAEGLEAKELLIDRNTKLLKCDSLILLLNNQVKDITTENILLKQNYQVVSIQNSLCSKNLDKTCIAYNKQANRKVFYRNTTIIETVLITIGLTLFMTTR